MEKETVKVFNKSGNDVPHYESEFAAGFDIRVSFDGKESKNGFLGNGEFNYNNEEKELTLFKNGGRVLIPTGLFVAIPDGYELQIRPRSGLAIINGISVLNSPGTIDSDYLGEICLILINTDSASNFVIKDGERLAQGVLNQIKQLEWDIVESVEELGDTVRGSGGFGHTGKN